MSATLNEWLLWFFDPEAWAALVTLIVLEIVLGIDNLIFISILTNKLPEERRAEARQVGMAMAVLLRLGLLGLIATIVSLTEPLFTVGGHAYSWRDVVLVAGGLFLIWKATREIHHALEPDEGTSGATGGDSGAASGKRGGIGFGAAITQIIVLDIVFSIDSILTAVGMTNQLPVMVTAVVIAVGLMLIAADPLARFIGRNPTVVMLALGFLLMIGAVLIADGFGVHVPKGYIYAAMAFSGGIEALNMAARRRKRRGAGH